jgi:hypothetical protein
MKLQIKKQPGGCWFMGYGPTFLGTFASFESARNSMFLWPSYSGKLNKWKVS